MKGRKLLPIIEDFESRIFYSPDGCWHWTGVIFNSGYGQYRNKLAHRVSYELFVNNDVSNLKIFHSCKNRSCVNPHHLTSLTVKFREGFVGPRLIRESTKDRFEKYIMPEPNTGCWFWMARINPSGYGVFGIGKKKIKAHRYSYELYKHKIKHKMLVCHTCDIPACVNPDHLFLGTYKDNAQDMIKKGRASWQKNKLEPAR